MPDSRRNISPIAVTMGEPCGIGPEIVARIWQERPSGADPFFMIGHEDALLACDAALPIRSIDNPAEAFDCFDHALPVLRICESLEVSHGSLVPSNSAAVISSIEKAVSLARSRQVSAIVTSPIHKAALAQAGLSHPGHTDFLAALCDKPVSDAVMMLANSQLRAVPVTVHQSLRDAIGSITSDRIVKTTLTVVEDLQDRFGLENPRVAISGLNPHAGEEGLMGMEDGLIIKPAVETLAGLGISVKGPLPADTMFHEAARATYDVAICMYHDQALIPVKTLDFHGGVNVTLGLPVIRTSPDHGTALEIAGTGNAETGSFKAALEMAAKMARHQQS